VRKATSLQNRAYDIRQQQQLQQQAITETIVLENSRAKRGDVLDLQELESVLVHMEMLQALSGGSERSGPESGRGALFLSMLKTPTHYRYIRHHPVSAQVNHCT
jgi:hypothetical protein